LFIVWGTKVRHRNLGYRAEFCRICRQIRPFKVVQIRSVGHIYYIPIGSGTIHGHTMSCEQCGIAINADVEDAMNCSPKRVADLAELIAKTRPQIEQECSGRLDLEARVKSKKLTAQERETLILEPFLLLNPGIQARSGQILFDKVSGIGCLATIAIPLAIIWIGMARFPGSDETRGKFALGAAGLLTIFTLGALATDGRRFGRRKIVPKLAAALAPLDPTPEEIDRAFAKMKQMKWAIGKKIKSEDVTNAIHSYVPLE
jgi:hypothetical protein